MIFLETLDKENRSEELFNMIFQTLDKPNRSKELFSMIFLETLDRIVQRNCSM